MSEIKKKRAVAAQNTRAAELDRQCGTCNACCTTLGVPEIDKPAGERCSNLVEGRKGCSIYAARPGVCRTWSCLWRRGSFDGVDRPDRVGVIMDVTDHNKQIWPDGQALIARPAFPGGLEQGTAFLMKAARLTVVIVVDGQSRRILAADEEKRMKVQKLFDRHLPVIG